MTIYSQEQMRRLSAGFRTLRELQSIFRDLRQKNQLSNQYHSEAPTGALASEIAELNQEFPRILPVFSGRMEDTEAYLTRALPRIEVLLDETSEVPGIEQLNFSFIRDEQLRLVIERDCEEIQKTLVVRCWKAAIILSGSAIEAILLDLLQAREADAKAAKKAPKTDILQWDLNELIKVAVELHLIVPSVEGLATSVRQYRNLIHPGRELKSGLRPDKLEAESGFTILRIIHRELSR